MNRYRGLNFGGWLSQIDAIEEKDPTGFPGIDAHMEQFLGADDFTQVAKWGFNHVRLPVDYNYFFDEEANPIKSRFRYLDEALAAALANHLLVMLDLHKCPGHTFHDESKQVQLLFQGDKHIQLTVRVWQTLAERYGGFKNVLFEVLNEPVAPTPQIWNKVKDRLCVAIRSFAPDIPIVVGSNMWNWPSTYPDFTPVNDGNVVYCFHFYEPLLFTHQQAPWLPEPEFRREYDYPDDYGNGVVRQYDLRMSAGNWNKARFEKELAPVFAFRDKYDVPMICNEFGVYAGVPREPQLRWMSDFLAVLKENDIGFSYWNYKNLDFGIISKDESTHAHLERYNNPKRLDRQMLQVLREG
ncbi:MAG: cellulase family glycosylhydrolase [Deltaproteobacteria bacterium]|nr:cellulase family glycosylhydrolase [Deltaproteobacteria bacterium]MBN2670023.1 cellulase family glycosylhydrolase [Deltaproteobacteria bacterium]